MFLRLPEYAGPVLSFVVIAIAAIVASKAVDCNAAKDSQVQSPKRVLRQPV